MPTDEEDPALDRQVGQVIKDEIERTGMKINSFAKVHGLSKFQLYNWIKGEVSPSFTGVNRWAEALGISPLEILERAGYGGQPLALRDRLRAVMNEAGLDDDYVEVALRKIDPEA